MEQQYNLCVHVMGKSYLITDSGSIEVNGVLPFNFNEARASPCLKEIFHFDYCQNAGKHMISKSPFSHLNACLPHTHLKVI